MTKEFQTLTFENNPSGQKKKIDTLNKLSAEGWKVTSETITQGKFKGGKACCLFTICMPLAFCAGNKDGTINVTLERENLQ